MGLAYGLCCSFFSVLRMGMGLPPGLAPPAGLVPVAKPRGLIHSEIWWGTFVGTIYSSRPLTLPLVFMSPGFQQRQMRMHSVVRSCLKRACQPRSGVLGLIDLTRCVTFGRMVSQLQSCWASFTDRRPLSGRPGDENARMQCYSLRVVEIWHSASLMQALACATSKDM